MRFVLDHDVDVAVRGLLTALGHECWRAPTYLEVDDDVSVYADDKDAVVVTHDVEFTRRRQLRTFGRHVRLRCDQVDGVEVLAGHIHELVDLLATQAEGVFIVSRSRIEFKAPRWEDP